MAEMQPYALFFNILFFALCPSFAYFFLACLKRISI